MRPTHSIVSAVSDDDKTKINMLVFEWHFKCEERLEISRAIETRADEVAMNGVLRYQIGPCFDLWVDDSR